MSDMRLFDTKGNRLYLTMPERAAFLDGARAAPPEVRTLAETLAYTGCRLSEALELVPKRVQLDEGRMVFRSLKKRREDVYRAVPVPPEYLDTLNIVHRIRDAQKSKRRANEPLWTWTRQHASSEIVKRLMITAGIAEGAHRTAKGLRHAYGVNAISRKVPLNMLQKWMGHADIATTAIYADAIGEEEANIAAQMGSRPRQTQWRRGRAERRCNILTRNVSDLGRLTEHTRIESRCCYCSLTTIEKRACTTFPLP